MQEMNRKQSEYQQRSDFGGEKRSGNSARVPSGGKMKPEKKLSARRRLALRARCRPIDHQEGTVAEARIGLL